MKSTYSEAVITLSTADLEEAGYDTSRLSKEEFETIYYRMAKYYDSGFGEILHDCVDGILSKNKETN